MAVGSRDLSPPGRVLDLGSGGGVHGLVLAAVWPDTHFVLLDVNFKRTEFLNAGVAALGLDERVTVCRARAEDQGRHSGMRQTFDLVVARGFSSPPVTAECAAPFLKLGGFLVVSEPPLTGGTTSAVPPWPLDGPPNQQREDRWEGLEKTGLGLSSVAKVAVPRSYQVFRQSLLCDDRYPRRVGVPAKRPLF
ncbi:MAG: 16S rRNA (guanine(527)-N(7))-methyltransferase RsmG [Acidimicrobiales bacterium]